MVVIDRINECVQLLPKPLQVEVLHFAESLRAKARSDAAPQEDREWSVLSLSLAMQGMENEDGPEYTLSDLKESFS